MKKIDKNTYKYVTGTVLISGVLILIGAGGYFKKNNFNERDKIMSKEKNLQVPEFLKKKMNDGVKPKTASVYTVDETTHDQNAYVKQFEEECVSEVIKDEDEELTMCESIVEQYEKISEIQKEKYDYIKGLSVVEQMIVLNNIPIELCMMRINKEIDELKMFKATISDAMSMLK